MDTLTTFDIIADGMIRAGWHVLGTQVETRHGELDMVAARTGTIVFATVLSVTAEQDTSKLLNTASERRRIRQSAVAWMASHPRDQRGVKRYRFDVYYVHRDLHGEVTRIEHVRDAF